MKTDNLQKSKSKSKRRTVKEEVKEEHKMLKSKTPTVDATINSPVSPVPTPKKKVSAEQPKPKQMLRNGSKILSAKNNLWRILGHLGSGGFGDVFKVEECQSPGKFYAMKTEMKAAKMARLRVELQILMEINEYIDKKKEDRHFCELLDLGNTKLFSWIVMTLIGPSLDSVRRLLKKQFTKTTVMNISLQILDAIRLIHSVGFIHRDLKPANVCVGCPPKNDKILFLLDFGISRRIFKSAKSKDLRKERKKVPFFGTRKFCSRACHLEMDQGRKDDIETYIYTVLDLLHNEKGLTWNCCIADTKKIQDKKIALFKNPQKELNSFIPQQFCTIINYVSGLKFSDAVEYKVIEDELKEIAKDKNLDLAEEFDWSGRLESLISEKERRENKGKKEEATGKNKKDGDKNHLPDKEKSNTDASVSKDEELRNLTDRTDRTDKTYNRTRKLQDMQSALTTVKKGDSKKRPQSLPDSKVESKSPVHSRSNIEPVMKQEKTKSNRVKKPEKEKEEDKKEKEKEKKEEKKEKKEEKKKNEKKIEKVKETTKREEVKKEKKKETTKREEVKKEKEKTKREEVKKENEKEKEKERTKREEVKKEREVEKKKEYSIEETQMKTVSMAIAKSSAMSGVRS